VTPDDASLQYRAVLTDPASGGFLIETQGEYSLGKSLYPDVFRVE